jgi:hypothetical protein
MTAEEHNRTIGILHLVYGGFHLLTLLAIFGIMIAIGVAGAVGGPRDAFPAVIMIVFAAVFILFASIFTIPSFVGGYALLKKKEWAKVASIVAAIFEATGFPLGTALCVYSLWFMFGDMGKSLYDRGYHPPRPDPVLLTNPDSEVPFQTATKSADMSGSAIPRKEPPDWR